MKKIPFAQSLLFLVVLTLLNSGCGQSNSSTESKETPSASATQLADLFPHASDNFLATVPFLEIGGELLFFADLEDDILDAARLVDTILPPLVRDELPPEFQNIQVARMFETLHLNGLKTIGMSSRRVGPVYQNRTFLYLPEGRQGIFRLWGDEPLADSFATKLPADALVFFETQWNPSETWPVLLESTESLLGPRAKIMLEGAVGAAFMGIPGYLPEWEAALPHHIGLALLPGQPEETIDLPEITLPLMQFAVHLAGPGDLLTQYFLGDLVSEGFLVQSDLSEQTRQYTIAPGHQDPSFPYPQIALLITGKDVYLVSGPNLIDPILSPNPESSFARTEAFQKLMANFPSDPRGLLYLSPEIGSLVESIIDVIVGDDPELLVVMPMVEGLWKRFLPQGEPFYQGRFHYPEGILYLSQSSQSHKQALPGIGNSGVVGVGIMAGIAIPAFNRTREASREALIRNNLRMIAAAANQYFLETGQSQVVVRDLIGPGQYISTLESVAGEDYSNLVINVNDREIVLVLPDGRIFSQPL